MGNRQRDDKNIMKNLIPLSPKEIKYFKRVYGGTGKLAKQLVKSDMLDRTEDPQLTPTQIRLTADILAFLNELVIDEAARTRIRISRQRIFNAVMRHYQYILKEGCYFSLSEYMDKMEAYKEM